MDSTYITLSGHRNLNAKDNDRIKSIFPEILGLLERDYGRYNLLTQLADGADQLMARTAIERGCNITAVIPMGIEGFCVKDLSETGGFHAILGSDNVDVVELRLKDGEDAAKRTVRNRYYRAADEYCLERSKAAVVVWNGKYIERETGTATVVKQAVTERQIPVYWIPAGGNKEIQDKARIQAMKIFGHPIELREPDNKNAFYIIK